MISSTNIFSMIMHGMKCMMPGHCLRSVREDGPQEHATTDCQTLPHAGQSILHLCTSAFSAQGRTGVLQKKLDMRHSGKVFRRKVLRDQARRSASKVEGGACPTFFVIHSYLIGRARLLRACIMRLLEGFLVWGAFS